MNELEKSDFISFNPQIDTKKKDAVYRLADEYTLFYLTWVEPLGRTFKDQFYWQKQVGKPRYNTWLGHTFEALCFKHSEMIKIALGIAGLTTHVYQFHNDKVQIDMAIDRSDKSINLCEMKYSTSPFSMTAEEASKIERRKRALLLSRKRKVQVFVTLVTPIPAIRNKHYLGSIDNEINLQSLFK